MSVDAKNRIDRLSAIRLFLDTADLGSFSAAARRHGLSPAAVSASILRLEAGLNVKLFVRTTRQLRMTAEGLLYKHFCEPALAMMAEGEQYLHAGLGAVSGMVKMSVPPDIGRNVLLPCLAQCRATYPDVQFSLILSDSTQGTVKDDIDVAIRYGQLPLPDMVARPLASNRRVVCVAPSLAVKTGMPAQPDDLRSLPTIVLSTQRGPMDEWHYRQGGKAASVRLTDYQQTNDGDILRKWAIAGEGFAYKSLLDIGPDLQAGRLITVLDNYFTERLPLQVLTHRNRFQPPRIRLVVDFLVDYFESIASPVPEIERFQAA